MKEDCYNLPLHYTRTQWNHKDVDDDDDDDDDDGGGGGGDEQTVNPAMCGYQAGIIECSRSSRGW